jgi:cyclic pyranopterin phosphate synthase
MSIGTAIKYQGIPGSEVAALIESEYGTLTPFSGITGNGPAVYYSLPHFIGKIGFINPITHGFCEKCNRLRLTSEGFLKLCLSDNIGLDLRQLLRSGVTDTVISKAILEAVKKKPKHHTFSDIYNLPKNHPENMSRIGG